MSNFITINDVTFDSFFDELEEIRINKDSVIWAGEDYDGNLVVCFSDPDGVRIVRTCGQTLDEVFGDD